MRRNSYLGIIGAVGLAIAVVVVAAPQDKSSRPSSAGESGVQTFRREIGDRGLFEPARQGAQGFRRHRSVR